MFSTSKLGVCVAMMMMMMTLAAAMPNAAGHSKHGARTHGKSEAAVETVPLQLDPRALVPSGNLRPLQNASISPWTYNMSHDEALLPSALSEARCLLRGCLDSEGREDLSLESRPIMHQVLLLRRVRSKGSGSEDGYHFRLESRLIAVGCTCVRPSVRHQD